MGISSLLRRWGADPTPNRPRDPSPWAAAGRHLSPLVLAAVALMAACGDSNAGATSTPTSETAATTIAESNGSATAPTATSEPVPTTAPSAATSPADCRDVVERILELFQVVLDEYGALSLADLAAAAEEPPEFLTRFERDSAEVEALRLQLGCSDEQIAEGIAEGLGQLQASGPAAELVLDGLIFEFSAVDLPAAADIPSGVETFEVSDQSHTEESVDYPQDPPVGGPHHPVWLNCGFYDEPVPNENAVHSLEHGVVWVTFTPDLPTDQVEVLRLLAREPEVIVSPYPSLGSAVVASAWGAQMEFQSASDPELLDFVVALRDTTAPEPGASCVGGVGDPE